MNFSIPRCVWEIMFEPRFPILHDPKNQDLACQEFLGTAFSLGIDRSRLPKQDEIVSRLESFSKMATRLRQDAQSLVSLGLHKFTPALEVMAIACEKNAKQPDLGVLHPIVKRSRGDQVFRAYVFRLSMFCQETFGKWLPGTVATTASVALSKKISGHQVRDMVRAITSGLTAAPKTELKQPRPPSGPIETSDDEADDEQALREWAMRDEEERLAVGLVPLPRYY